MIQIPVNKRPLRAFFSRSQDFVLSDEIRDHLRPLFEEHRIQMKAMKHARDIDIAMDANPDIRWSDFETSNQPKESVLTHCSFSQSVVIFEL